MKRTKPKSILIGILLLAFLMAFVFPGNTKADANCGNHVTLVIYFNGVNQGGQNVKIAQEAVKTFTIESFNNGGLRVNAADYAPQTIEYGGKTWERLSNNYNVSFNFNDLERNKTKEASINYKAKTIPNPPPPEVEKYTVTFDSQGGSAVSPITGVEKGSSVTLPSQPTKENCTFLGWFTSAEGGNEFTSQTPVNGNITVYAHWECQEEPIDPPAEKISIRVKLLFQSKEGDTTLKSSEDLSFSEDLFTEGILEADFSKEVPESITHEGKTYLLYNKEDLAQSLQLIAYNEDKDFDYQFVFRYEEKAPVINEYTIVSSAGAGGSITPLGNTIVKEGNAQGYVITAEKGYKISKLLVDGSAVEIPTDSAYTFENVKSDHTIAVEFEKITEEAVVVSNAGPKTGDDSFPIAWLVIAGLSLTGALTAYRKKKTMN